MVLCLVFDRPAVPRRVCFNKLDTFQPSKDNPEHVVVRFITYAESIFAKVVGNLGDTVLAKFSHNDSVESETS